MLSELPFSSEPPCVVPLDLSNAAEAVPSTLPEEALSVRLVALGAVAIGSKETSSGGTRSGRDILRPL